MNGRAQLITPGTGETRQENGIYVFNQPGLVGVSADGTDVYFSTVDTLVPQDHNGLFLKFYDARAGGGFRLRLGRLHVMPRTSATARAAHPRRFSMREPKRSSARVATSLMVVVGGGAPQKGAIIAAGAGIEARPVRMRVPGTARRFPRSTGPGRVGGR